MVPAFDFNHVKLPIIGSKPFPPYKGGVELKRAPRDSHSPASDIRHFPKPQYSSRSRKALFPFDFEGPPEGLGEGASRCPPRGSASFGRLRIRTSSEWIHHEAGREDGGGAGAGSTGLALQPFSSSRRTYVTRDLPPTPRSA